MRAGEYVVYLDTHLTWKLQHFSILVSTGTGFSTWALATQQLRETKKKKKNQEATKLGNPRPVFPENLKRQATEI